MRELTANELNDVSGGNPLALVGIALGIIYSADKLSDFFNGFFDGAGGLPEG